MLKALNRVLGLFSTTSPSTRHGQQLVYAKVADHLE